MVYLVRHLEDRCCIRWTPIGAHGDGRRQRALLSVDPSAFGRRHSQRKIVSDCYGDDWAHRPFTPHRRIAAVRGRRARLELVRAHAVRPCTDRGVAKPCAAFASGRARCAVALAARQCERAAVIPQIDARLATLGRSAPREPQRPGTSVVARPATRIMVARIHDQRRPRRPLAGGSARRRVDRVMHAAVGG